eukprot:3066295-Amphidinium_carterae.1
MKLRQNTIIGMQSWGQRHRPRGRDEKRLARQAKLSLTSGPQCAMAATQSSTSTEIPPSVSFPPLTSAVALKLCLTLPAPAPGAYWLLPIVVCALEQLAVLLCSTIRTTRALSNPATRSMRLQVLQARVSMYCLTMLPAGSLFTCLLPHASSPLVERDVIQAADVRDAVTSFMLRQRSRAQTRCFPPSGVYVFECLRLLLAPCCLPPGVSVYKSVGIEAAKRQALNVVEARA